MIYGWNPQIGDPTLYGWLTVLLYAVAAWLCGRAAQVGPTGERRFWFILCGILAFLCINKELDLQSMFTAIGRGVAKSQGWYEDRRQFQLFFIGVLIVVAIAGTIALLTVMRRARWPVLGAVGGLVVLMTFILMRASSMEKIDLFIDIRVGGVRMNNVLEIAGIAILAACAIAARRGQGRTTRR